MFKNVNELTATQKIYLWMYLFDDEDLIDQAIKIKPDLFENCHLLSTTSRHSKLLTHV